MKIISYSVMIIVEYFNTLSARHGASFDALRNQTRQRTVHQIVQTFLFGRYVIWLRFKRVNITLFVLLNHFCSFCLKNSYFFLVCNYSSIILFLKNCKRSFPQNFQQHNHIDWWLWHYIVKKNKYLLFN
jgi:hypothetical protein